MWFVRTNYLQPSFVTNTYLCVFNFEGSWYISAIKSYDKWYHSEAWNIINVRGDCDVNLSKMYKAEMQYNAVHNLLRGDVGMHWVNQCNNSCHIMIYCL